MKFALPLFAALALSTSLSYGQCPGGVCGVPSPVFQRRATVQINTADAYHNGIGRATLERHVTVRRRVLFPRAYFYRGTAWGWFRGRISFE